MRAVGYLLLLVGACIMLIGLTSALRELIDLYQQVAADPLGTGVLEEDSGLQQRILIDAALGATGLVPSAVGFVLLRVARARRLRRQQEKTSQL